MNGKLSLDTNAVIRYFDNHPSVVQILNHHTDIFIPVPVVGELLYAAYNSTRITENIGKYKGFIEKCHVLTISAQTADYYARLRLELKQKGKPIPENDLWIAALCLEHQTPLATQDGHFKWIDDLTLETW